MQSKPIGSKRRIDVSGASLVGLKAEIAKRQGEIRAKATVVPDVSGAVIKRTGADGTTKRIFKRPSSPPEPRKSTASKDTPAPAEDPEWEKTRRSLQAKAKLYEALRQAAAPQNEDDTNDTDPLVDFERKAMEEEKEGRRRNPDTLEYYSGDSSDDEDDRYYADRRRDDPREAEPVSIPDGPVTYAHLRKGEVRDHGTGFYAFSADADERAAEQAALRELRRRTERARQQTEAEQAKRSVAMAQRLAKLRARKGLPDVATAAANLLPTTEEKKAETGEEEGDTKPAESVEPPPPGERAGGEELGSDDLDIASMLRRLRDEAEQKQAAMKATTELTHYAPPREEPLIPQKRMREWDRGKTFQRQSSPPRQRPPPSSSSAASYRRRLREDEREPEFAPPSFYR